MYLAIKFTQLVDCSIRVHESVFSRLLMFGAWALPDICLV